AFSSVFHPWLKTMRRLIQFHQQSSSSHLLEGIPMKKWFLLSIVLLVALGTGAIAQTPAVKNSWGGAAWVWDEPDANKVPQNNEPRYLRRTFELSSRTVQAELWISADNIYTAYVNGQKIGTGAEWSNVGKYDVAKSLVVGKNVLAI